MSLKASPQCCNLTIQDLLANKAVLLETFKVTQPQSTERRNIPLCTTCLWEVGKHQQQVKAVVQVQAAAGPVAVPPPVYREPLPVPSAPSAK